MPKGRLLAVLPLALALVASGCGRNESKYDPFFTGPDTRETCRDRDPLRKVFFGDLHSHTHYSFDAASSDVRAKPDDAYRFAKGEPIDLPPYDASGAATRRVSLARPLDFLAVTDHSEFLAETSICTDPTLPGYDSEQCRLYRDNAAAGVGNGTFSFALALAFPARPAVCDPPSGGCDGQIETVWKEINDAAEAHYDRSADCTFTTFVAYEWSGAVNANNWHRNVIFANRTVPKHPLSYLEYPRPEQLWSGLHANCLDARVGCDVLTIPHNGNISSGLMFRAASFDDGTPYDAATSRLRREMEPLLEIYQHKGASECTPGPLTAFGSTDEQCSFELLVPDVCKYDGTDGPRCVPECDPNPAGGFLGTCVASSDFARGALRSGLLERARTGENPFEYGFVGSTDTHGAIPGAVEEASWPGHVGVTDDTPQERLAEPKGPLVVSIRSSPGGLAGVWSEENSRPAIFAALRRRETFATSGTRLAVRFFAGSSIASGICSAPDLLAQAYRDGVPMGGTLSHATASPRFVVTALRDPDGAQLQAVEIVKGFYDGTTTHERVYPIYTAPNGGTAPSVDLATCTPMGTGVDSLCTEWTDPDFDASQAAFYYVRVRENPTCRWSRRLCQTVTVDCSTATTSDPFYGCCDPTVPKTIEERAWSSPIWLTP